MREGIAVSRGVVFAAARLEVADLVVAAARPLADVESELKFALFLLPVSLLLLTQSADRCGKTLLWSRRGESNFRVISAEVRALVAPLGAPLEKCAG